MFETTDRAILEQFYNELKQFEDDLKERGIKVGNKVKLRNGAIDTIIDIGPYEPDYPIKLRRGSSHTIKGSYRTVYETPYDIVDWDYKEPEDITPSNPDASIGIKEN